MENPENVKRQMKNTNSYITVNILDSLTIIFEDTKEIEKIIL